MAGYDYKGTGRTLSPSEAEAALARNNRAAPGPPSVAAVPPPKTLKGCVKVDGFPERSKYPFAEIAADGGIWRVDPREFGVKPNTVQAAVAKWAAAHKCAGTARASDSYVYVQFSPVRAGTR